MRYLYEQCANPKCTHIYSWHMQLGNGECSACRCSSFQPRLVAKSTTRIKEIHGMAGIDMHTAMGISMINNERCNSCDHERRYHRAFIGKAGIGCHHIFCRCPDFREKPKETPMPASPTSSTSIGRIQSADIKISADKRTKDTTITLPCGQKRALSTATMDILIDRLKCARDYLVNAEDSSREF